MLGHVGIMGGSDYKAPPPQTSPDQNKRGAPNQVREKLFGGARSLGLVKGSPPAGSLSGLSRQRGASRQDRPGTVLSVPVGHQVPLLRR